MAGNDWVDVRLTEFGAEYSKGAPLHVHEGAHQFSFRAGEMQRVTRAFDWNRVLKNVVVAGRPLLEIVPDEHAEELVEKWRAEAYTAEVVDGRPVIDVPKDEKEHGGE